MVAIPRGLKDRSDLRGYCLHSASYVVKRSNEVDGGSLLPPFFTAIETPDEDRHRLIRRPGLHLPVPRPRLPAFFALEHVRTFLRIAIQHRRLPFQLFIC